jgi:tight adherence protein C
VSVVVFIGVGVGLGLFLIGRGLMPAPTPLATSLLRLERTGESVHQRRASAVASDRSNGAVARWAAAVLSGRLGAKAEADLAVVERTAERFAIEKVGTGLSLAGIACALLLVLQFAESPLGLGLGVVIVVFSVAVGFVTPDLALRSQAASRRAAFRHALSSYLDLVNILLAGGAGIETSLEAAAEAGDGWAFTQIRNALLRARAMRASPWESFSELGERIGVTELSEIAASVKLAGEQGARVKLSLAAKASALRAHQMARIEADAQAATERMGLPTALMFVGFMVLLGYPAMEQIVNAL